MDDAVLIERFLAFVEQGGPDECWEWQGARDRHGYGQFWVPTPAGPTRGKVSRAQRISYALAYGDIPDDLQINHHCDNPPCVNPTHLYAGTHRENTLDMVERGRWRGGRPTGARTEHDVKKPRS